MAKHYRFLGNILIIPFKGYAVLEQVGNFQAVKKAPFEATNEKAQKLGQSSAQQIDVPDFKSALQKSLQNPTQDFVQNSSQTKPIHKNIKQQSKSTQNNATQSTIANPLAHKNNPKHLKSLSLENIDNTKDITKGIAKNLKAMPQDLLAQDFSQETHLRNTPNKNTALQNALLKEKISPKNALDSSKQTLPNASVQNHNLPNAQTKKHINALNSIAQNASKAANQHAQTNDLQANDLAESSEDFSQDIALQNLNQQPQKKDLNQMARNKSQEETLLSKIMQNPQKQEAQPKQTTSKSDPEALDDNELDSIKSNNPQAFANQIQAQSTQNTQNANVQNLAKSSQAPTSTNQTPSLENVAKKAQELGLNPSNIRYEDDETTATSNAQAKTKANPSANEAKQASKNASANKGIEGVKTYFEDDEALRPLFDMLESFDVKNAAKRKVANKATSIKYIQNGEDKIAVISRTKQLPKNITDQRIKNQRQEKIFEQIQKDLLAGKELNLSQIEQELSNLENGLFDDKEHSAINPLNTKGSTKPALNSKISNPTHISTLASATLSAKSLNGDLKDSSKNGSRHFSKEAKEAKESKTTNQSARNANTSTISNEPTNATTQESSVDKWLNTPQFAQNEIEQNAQNLNDTLKVKQAAQQEISESKAESKSEAKTLSSTNASTNSLKNDTRTNNINPKEALSYFVNQFEQEVKKFKPPMRQISMELSPKELGNIELTITQRGNSLHISVLSNPQALQLFAQNQVELRQNLLNAGFEGVDLSFSSNGGNGSNAGNEQNSGNENASTDSNTQDSLAQHANNNANDDIIAMEITLPRYA